MRMRIVLASFLAIATLSGAGQALAQTAPPPAAPAAETPADPDAGKFKITISIGGEAKITDPKMIEDQRAVRDAYSALAKGGYPALKPYLAALERVLARAPAAYPKVEITEGRALFRADPGEGAGEMSMVGIMAVATAKGSVLVERTMNVYPWASFMLGGYAVEAKRYDEAVAYLDKGLKLQPASAFLLSEKGAALQGAGRSAEALATYDHGLNVDDALDLPSEAERARLLRGRGYALGQLGRLDEAVAAYDESLKIEPESWVAKNGLRHLAERKAGRPAGPPQVILPGDPAAQGSKP